MIYPRRGAVLVAGLVLAVYAWLYYATPLSILPSGPEGVPRRALFLTFLLRPDDLVQQWLGSPAAPAFLDRLPVLLLAGGVFALATGLGWVAIRLLKADRGLSRLERFVFSAGVGLNLVSTYVLAMGLLGGMNRWLLFYLPVAITLAAIVWLYRQAVSSEVPRQDSQVPSDADASKQMHAACQTDDEKRALAEDVAAKAVASIRRTTLIHRRAEYCTNLQLLLQASFLPFPTPPQW